MKRKEKNNLPSIVIVILGLFNKEDAHYSSAQMILEKLAKDKTKFIYPATVIVESTTILKLRLKKPQVADQIYPAKSTF